MDFDVVPRKGKETGALNWSVYRPEGKPLVGGSIPPAGSSVFTFRSAPVAGLGAVTDRLDYRAALKLQAREIRIRVGRGLRRRETNEQRHD